MPPRETTRDRIQRCAVDLFERQGYEATTVADVARAAAVSDMTVYRHFSTKAALAVDDPFDPRIVEAVGAQPRQLPPLQRVVRAMSAAVAGLATQIDELALRRSRIVASTPALWGAVAENNARTQQLISRQLVDDGADRLDAAVASAAVLAAITAALLEHDHDGDATLASVVGRALDIVAPRS